MNIHRRPGSPLHRFWMLGLGAVLAAPVGALEDPARELVLPPIAVDSEPAPELGFDLPPASFPALPVEQLGFRGARHGHVNTTMGNLVFRMADLRLPGRMPIELSRVYDSSFSESMPPPPPSQQGNPRWTADLGDNWVLAYSSYLINTSSGYTMATPDGDVIEWVSSGGGSYVREPDGPSPFVKVQNASGGNVIATHVDGTKWTYVNGIMSGGDKGLSKIEDRSGNFLEFIYQSGFLKQIRNSDGATVTINRPMFDPTHPPVTYSTTRITRMTDHTGRQVLLDYNSLGLLNRLRRTKYGRMLAPLWP